MPNRIAWSESILANLAAQIGAALPRIRSGVIIILLLLVSARLLRRILRAIAGRFDMERRPLIDPGADAAWVAAITLGFIVGFGTMGVDVSALVASLGLTGFALGFAPGRRLQPAGRRPHHPLSAILDRRPNRGSGERRDSDRNQSAPHEARFAEDIA